jgi:hypothetical protein
MREEFEREKGQTIPLLLESSSSIGIIVRSDISAGARKNGCLYKVSWLLKLTPFVLVIIVIGDNNTVIRTISSFITSRCHRVGLDKRGFFNSGMTPAVVDELSSVALLVTSLP